MFSIVGIPLIAYSPLSRGCLSDQIRSFEDIPEDDYRRRFPRFQSAAFDQNLKLVRAVEEIAKRKGVTTAQVAMAWVRRQGAIPIPGSTKTERIKENCTDVDLNDEELKEIQKIVEALPIQGERYGGLFETQLNQ